MSTLAALGQDEPQTLFDHRRKRSVLRRGLALGAGEEVVREANGYAFDHSSTYIGGVPVSQISLWRALQNDEREMGSYGPPPLSANKKPGPCGPG